MGRCYEFDRSLDSSSEHAMVVAPEGGYCLCPSSGAVRHGQFAGCSAIVSQLGRIPPTAPSWSVPADRSGSNVGLGAAASGRRVEQSAPPVAPVASPAQGQPVSMAVPQTPVQHQQMPAQQVPVQHVPLQQVPVQAPHVAAPVMVTASGESAELQTLKETVRELRSQLTNAQQQNRDDRFTSIERSSDSPKANATSSGPRSMQELRMTSTVFGSRWPAFTRLSSRCYTQRKLHQYLPQTIGLLVFIRPSNAWQRWSSSFGKKPTTSPSATSARSTESVGK
ncbi:MAG: hypothetical protein ACI8Y4_000124 [Candidatus Poriferisodalaceae bacterium]|jgi:hypothetical protein